MAKLMYLQSSPRKDRSRSNKIAEAFLQTYMSKNPDDEIIKINLFKKILPPFDGFTINAKYNIMHGEKQSPEETDAWKIVEEIIEEFKSADKYLFSVPMWNFGIPYRLKQYIDIITQPTYTFGVDPEKGYIGLVTGKPAMVVYSRGGNYAEQEIEKQVDHQKSYLNLILGFIGFTDIKSVTVQPTLAEGPETAAAKVEQAIKQAENISYNF
jgi:FMN-dependent NADH-azoreductase